MLILLSFPCEVTSEKHGNLISYSGYSTAGTCWKQLCFPHGTPFISLRTLNKLALIYAFMNVQYPPSHAIFTHAFSLKIGEIRQIPDILRP